MKSARDDILGRVGRALPESADTRRDAARAHLSAGAVNTIPARGQVQGEALVTLFAEMVQAAKGQCERLDHGADLAGAVRRAIDAAGLPPEVARAADPRLAAADWAAAGLTVKTGAPGPEVRVSVTGAFAAVAESGTVMVLSGPDHPYTLNLTVDLHIVAITPSQIVGTYEDAWDRFRRDSGDKLPRMVQWITGPSRTADIAGRMLFGAHGPRHFHVLVVDDMG